MLQVRESSGYNISSMGYDFTNVADVTLVCEHKGHDGLLEDLYAIGEMYAYSINDIII